MSTATPPSSRNRGRIGKDRWSGTRTCELAVIGSGPGGYAAALAASRRGLRVALVERGALGGVCLNVGCIPTKALVAVAHTLRRIRQAEAFGIHVDGVRLAYDEVLARNATILSTLRDGLTTLLRRSQVEILRGTAVLEDAHTVRIHHAEEAGQSSTLAAERIVLATGASPRAQPWTFDGKRLLSYRDLLALPALPASLLIVGGGVISCEFASCLSLFGVAVTVVEQQPQLLPTEDSEAVRLLTRHLQARGVTVRTGATLQRLTSGPDGVHATLASGESLRAQRCLIAIGQTPNSQQLGLERLGIQTRGGIAVNDALLTSQPHIAAIGDCLAGHGLAHLASYEGALAVRNLCESEPVAFDRRSVPRCVYTEPELAQVGLMESEVPDTARVSRLSFGALGKSLCDGDAEGFVKLMVDSATDEMLGATIVGAQASSLIHLAVVAIQHGLSAKQLARTITAHPTLPEAFTDAAAQIYGQALSTAGGARAPRKQPKVRENAQ